ncbi:uncharacterized protein LOC17887309 [Capsella rubella]|uniref:uncharacterized protein LOC17887309 n=1 Tax=Capsella rubella TaxID=81985 RepID=UPI000CD59B16|nr:uncharacterized protein LOC17887309 [Capsella rubella]XP_023638610.1 uncharacterized protein LOC17887309 [Capsella rubella]
MEHNLDARVFAPRLGLACQFCSVVANCYFCFNCNLPILISKRCRTKRVKSLSFTFQENATNRLITSKDHASVQLNIGHLDADGIYTGQFSTFALCGFVRA